MASGESGSRTHDCDGRAQAGGGGDTLLRGPRENLGGSYTPSGSWIRDMSIKPIIQIAVSHGPLKSHSVNASLVRSIV